MPQPIPTAVGAEPFKVNYLDASGEPAVRTFADNAEAHRFRASLTPGEDGKLPQLKNDPDPIEDKPDDEPDAPVILDKPDTALPPKPRVPPVLPGMVGDTTPGPKTVTAPVPVVTLPDADKS